MPLQTLLAVPEAPELTCAWPISDLVVMTNKRAMEALLWALKPLMTLRASMPIPFATTFLIVAIDEGKSINSYARDMGVSRFAMWRYVRNISERAKSGSPGLGLVTIESHPFYTRRRRVYLTAKGRSLARDILQQIRRIERSTDA